MTRLTKPEAQTGSVTTLPVASLRLLRVRSADKRGQGGCYDHKFCINFPCVRRDFRSLLRCNWGFLVCGTAAGSECSALVKAMPDIDVLLSQIARAKGAAAMIDTAIRKRFELMVAELQRGLAAIEQHPVSQRDSDKN